MVTKVTFIIENIDMAGIKVGRCEKCGLRTSQRILEKHVKVCGKEKEAEYLR